MIGPSGSVNNEPCCGAHDRLDLIQQTLEYTAPACGSERRDTGKPAYCCFHCPTLVAIHVKAAGSEQ